MEAERTLNLLLEGCDDAAVESIIKKPAMEQMMNDLAKYLYTAGDFEMQIALTETLARLVKKSERHKYCALWFPSLAVGKAFLDIQDEQFDSDSRRFLNCLNSTCPQQSVISFSCKQAFLGNAELKSPNDENLSEFWVDFNSASHSITMYVADEESDAEEESGLWETVTYPMDKVVSYSILKTEDNGCFKLKLTLSDPPSSFLACASGEKIASMIFEPKVDLHKALALSLGQEKYVSPSMEPSLSRRSSVSKINVLVDRTKNTSWGLSNIPQSFHDGYVDCPGHVPQSVQESSDTSDDDHILKFSLFQTRGSIKGLTPVH
ncbi:synaptonemal complex protein 2-like [Diadema antillarum]|uniref:synaptonemal complex protein 2-like n=1 Tax=Diadema antillarum TaxID=105358 RepID=UPI003A896F59